MEARSQLELSEIEVMNEGRCSTGDQTFLDGSFENDFSSFIYDVIEMENYSSSIDEATHSCEVPFIKTAKRISEDTTTAASKTIESTRTIDSTSSSNHKDNQPSHSTNKIAVNSIILGEEKRTTVLISNITSKKLLNEIKDQFKSKFSSVTYEKSSKSNKGVACIHFTHPFHVILLFDLYHNKSFTHSVGDRLQVSYAKTSGNNQSTDDQKVNISQCDIEIPLKYKALFKRIYSSSVCIDRAHPWYSEGLFYVKRLGIGK